jgi:hypothetical protein
MHLRARSLDTRPRKPQIGRVDGREFHWLIGILEGEGTFLAPAPSSPASPLVRVVMTDRDVMVRVGADLERAVVEMPPRKESCKPAFAVSLKGADAVRLMVGIKSELGATRQQQIDLALRGWG